jgi:hypothetical protein
MDSQEYNIMEEMTKEVYAHFGSAYFFSECVHKGLCNLYALLSFWDKSDITAPRLEEKLKQAYSLTLGQIANKAKPYLPDTLQSDLDKAIEHRNYLAHHFWFERCHLMPSLEGLEELRSELIDLANLFRKLDHDIEDFLQPKFNAYGIDEKLIQLSLNEVMAGKPMDPLPNKRYPKKQERIMRAWNVKGEDGKFTIIFESDDGILWQLCDVGLGWSAYDKPEPGWEIDKKLQKYLPATINPRPQISEPWNYAFQLSAKSVFWIARKKDEPMFRCGIRSNSAGG